MEKLQPLLTSIATYYLNNNSYIKAWGIYSYLSYLSNRYETHKQLCEQHVPARYTRKQSPLEKIQLFTANILALDGYIAHFHAMQAAYETENNPEYLLATVNLFRPSTDEWLFYLNKYLHYYGCEPLLRFPDTDGCENCLSSLGSTTHCSPASSNEPLVSICISCFNSEKTIGYALRSLQQQTYKNLQIFVIDDNSTDNSAHLASQIAQQDSRICVIRNPVNCGTYVNRNRAYQMAKGDYFTVLDADDYALPDRIASQVTALEQRPETVAALSNWIRMTPDGVACFKFWASGYLHEGVATLMVRAKKVRNTIGYWDCVRIAADTEYLFRIRRVFGSQNVVMLNRPTTLALYHNNSLTRCKKTGISEEEGLSPVRLSYRLAWEKWHVGTRSLFLEFPLKSRPFCLPAGMPTDL